MFPGIGRNILSTVRSEQTRSVRSLLAGGDAELRRADALETLRTPGAGIWASGVSSLTLFGSVARDEARPDSDVDILVEFERLVGYLTLVRLGAYLEQILGCRADLVTPGTPTERPRERIRQQAVRAA